MFVSTLLVAIVGGSIVAFVQNSSYIIRKKKKAEAIQKLKLDSMINVINGTDEFQKAIHKFNIIMVRSAEDIAYSILNEDNLSEVTAKGLIIEKEKKFMELTHESASAINKFIFSLKRDMIINGKDEKVEEEIKKINIIYKRLRGFILRLDAKEIVVKGRKEFIPNIFDEGIEINPINESGKSVEIIWKIYKEKLDKEQEGWLDKLLNYFKRR